MHVSEFIGKKVLDRNAMEMGKVSDVDLMPIEGVINSITVSTGGLRNKDFVIKSTDIDRVGDYVILKFNDKSVNILEPENEEKPKRRLTLNK